MKLLLAILLLIFYGGIVAVLAARRHLWGESKQYDSDKIVEVAKILAFLGMLVVFAIIIAINNS